MRKLWMFISSVDLMQESKRPEDLNDWKELFGIPLLFLQFEIITMLFIVPSLLLSTSLEEKCFFYLFWGGLTSAYFIIFLILAIVGVIIIFFKKRKDVGVG